MFLAVTFQTSNIWIFSGCMLAAFLFAVALLSWFKYEDLKNSEESLRRDLLAREVYLREIHSELNSARRSIKDYQVLHDVINRHHLSLSETIALVQGHSAKPSKTEDSKSPSVLDRVLSEEP
jgi:hypothetical protein